MQMPFEAALTALADPVLVTDPRGVILWVNPAFTRQNGWLGREVVGRNARVLQSGETPAALYEAMWSEIQARRTWAGELVNRRKDGSRYETRLTITPVLGPVRCITHFVATHKDISAERSSTEALRRSEGSFRTLIEFLPDAVVACSQGRVVYANPKAHLFFRGGEAEDKPLIGLKILERVDPVDRQVVSDHFHSRDGDSTCEVRMLRVDATPFTAEIRPFAMFFDGRPSVGCVVRDITQQRRQVAQMLRLGNAISLGTLAGGVSHEINNPLAYVAANTEFAAASVGPIEAALRGSGQSEWGPLCDRLVETRIALEEAREGAHRIRKIVQELRAFCRLDSDGDDDPVDLCRVLESACRLAFSEIRHRAQLVKQFRQTGVVVGSAARLTQVFVNLLVNAAQSMTEGDASTNEIRVSAGRDDQGGAFVEVKDTGSGIRPEHLPRIFDPFFTTKPVGQGTGLGLGSCQQIVHNHRGEIEVESAPGRGTTFRVTLPATLAEAAPPDGETLAGQTAPLDGPAAPPARVLVVDDEPMIGRELARILEPRHQVVTVTSGAAALDLIQSKGPVFDVVFCDLMMPGMTGMEVYAQIRDRWPGLADRMVFLAGGSFPAAAQAFLRDVANPCLDKPINTTTLLEWVGARARTALLPQLLASVNESTNLGPCP